MAETSDNKRLIVGLSLIGLVLFFAVLASQETSPKARQSTTPTGTSTGSKSGNHGAWTAWTQGEIKGQYVVGTWNQRRGTFEGAHYKAPTPDDVSRWITDNKIGGSYDKAWHAAVCDGARKEMPSGYYRTDVLRDISKRPGRCEYRHTSEHKTTEPDRPTKREIWVTPHADGSWTYRYKDWMPSSTWLD